MAYEVLSGSVSVNEFFTSSFAQIPPGDDGRVDTSYQIIPNPAGTIWAAPVYYHGGDDGEGSFNYGINIYHSKSDGVFRADSIDTLNVLANNIWWISDTEFWAQFGSQAIPYRFISGASGFNDYDSNLPGVSHSTFTEGRLSADRKWFVTFPGSTTTTNRDKIAVFSSASQTTPGRWDRISTIPNAGFEVHFGNSGDSEVTNVHITPNLSNATPNFNGRYIFVAGGDFNSDQGECAVVEIAEDSSYIRNTRGSFSGDTMRGHATNSPRIGDGILYYHTASNRVIVGSSIANSGQGADKLVSNEIRYFDSSSQGFFNHTVRADNASSNGNFSDGTLITSSVRTMGAAQTHQHIDPNGSHDRIFIGSSYYSSGNNQKNGVIQALESGSSGWKLSVVGAHYPRGGSPSFGITPAGILADGGYFTASSGDYAGTSDASLDNTHSIAGSNRNPSHDGIYTFRRLSGISANPSIAASVTETVGTGGGTVKAGGTENSPKLTVTIGSGDLDGNTSITAAVVSDAAVKTANLSAIKKEAGSSGAHFVGDIIRLTPHGTEFNSAVQVQFELDSAPADLTIWKRSSHDGDNTQWFQLPNTLWSASGTTITINTTRFSEYAGLGGINVARTKLSNSQLEQLVSTDLVSSTSIQISSSGGSFKDRTLAAADLFLLEDATDGATFHISASQMAEFFGGLVTVTSSGADTNFRLTMVSATDSNDVGLEADSGLLFNPNDDLLTVSGDISVGDDLLLASNGAVLSFGAGAEVKLTHVDDLGIQLNGTSSFSFRDDNTYINSDAAGSLQARANTSIDLNIGGTDRLNVTAAGIHVEGAISGSTSLTLDTTTITTAEIAVLDGATSNSQASKVIVTDSNGDFEMQDSDKIFFGDDADVSIHWDGSAMKIGTDNSGKAITIGHSTSEVTIADNLIVAGDLTINGDTTTVSTTNLQVQDSLVELSDGASGSPVNDQGFIFNRGASDNAALLWDETAAMFKFANVGSASADSTGNLAHSATFPLSASAFHGDGSNLTGVGATVVEATTGSQDSLQLVFTSRSTSAGEAGTLYIDSGSLSWNPGTNTLHTLNISASSTLAVAGNSTFAGDVLPEDDNSSDLGSSGAQWKDLYVNGIGYIDQLGTDADPVGSAFISGGEIDGTVIGGESAAAATVTTLSASSTLSAAGAAVLGSTLNVSGAAKFKSNVTPVSNAGADLGSSALQWKDLYIDGIAYIDQIGTDADPVGSAFIAGGEIDGTVIGGESAAAATVTTLSASSTLSAAGATVLGSTLAVSGTATLRNTLTVQGATTLSSVGNMTVSPTGSTHHFLVTDTADNIVKKESVQDMASIFVTHGSGTLGGIKVSGGKMYIKQVELSFMSSSDNSSMSGSRNTGVAAGAQVTASLSGQVLSGSLMVFLNGLLQTRSGSANLATGSSSIFDYKLDSVTAPTKVIMADALEDDDVLIVRYIQK